MGLKGFKKVKRRREHRIGGDDGGREEASGGKVGEEFGSARSRSIRIGRLRVQALHWRLKK